MLVVRAQQVDDVVDRSSGDECVEHRPDPNVVSIAGSGHGAKVRYVERDERDALRGAHRTSNLRSMLTAREIGDFAVAAARDAVDGVVALLQTDPPSFNDFYETRLALLDALHVSDRDLGDGDIRDRRTWEHFAANSILTAARYELEPSEMEGDDQDGDDEWPDPDNGYRLLRDGDHDGALAMADVLLLAVASRPSDVWNYDYLLHHAHVLRGKVFLARGAPSASAVELLAASDISGSPQPDSFDPDLSLAWSLLNSDQDQAVLSYLRGVAQFWSPRDPAES